MRGSLIDVLDFISDCGSIPACAGKPMLSSAAAVFAPVYPRVCGEAVVKGDPVSKGSGLSPRVRGSPVGAVVGAAGAWSIPACAGKPPTPGSGTTRLAGLSPRVRGSSVIVKAASFHLGLSPRVRGSPGARSRPAALSGSIPACAGKPLRS